MRSSTSIQRVTFFHAAPSLSRRLGRRQADLDAACIYFASEPESPASQKRHEIVDDSDIVRHSAAVSRLRPLASVKTNVLSSYTARTRDQWQGPSRYPATGVKEKSGWI